MTEEDKPLKLVFKCFDPEEYGYLYKLNKELAPEDFKKAQPFMKNFTPSDFRNIMKISGDPHGWMCTEKNIPKVEKALNITETMEKFKKEQAELHKKYEAQRKIKDAAMDYIEKCFYDAQRPYQKLDILLKVAERVYDPANGFRDNEYYGGGNLFIYTKGSIWYIINNSRKWDNLEINNIEINDTLKAIGFRVPYTKELDHSIKVFSEENEYRF